MLAQVLAAWAGSVSCLPSFTAPRRASVYSDPAAFEITGSCTNLWGSVGTHTHTHLSQQAVDLGQFRGQASVLAQSRRKSRFTLVQLVLQNSGPGHGGSQIALLLLDTRQA